MSTCTDDQLLGARHPEPWPGPLDSTSTTSLAVTTRLSMYWSTCSALDPPRGIASSPTIFDACARPAPYVLHLQPLPGDPEQVDCRAWLCADHAARFRADRRAVRRLASIRTNRRPGAEPP